MEFKFNKKAQTATEYMIILAVVIIIALIVVGVLGGIPGLGTGAGGRASASYWATAPIGITSYAAAANATGTYTPVKLLIKNNNNEPIIITSINMSTTGQTIPASQLSPTTATTLGVGAEKYWSGTIAPTSGISLCNAVGDSWISNIRIVYQSQVSGATFIFEGEGTKLQGVCASSISN
jgi:uncharacterized protein (UPF0333 family)